MFLLVLTFLVSDLKDKECKFNLLSGPMGSFRPSLLRSVTESSKSYLLIQGTKFILLMNLGKRIVSALNWTKEQEF